MEADADGLRVLDKRSREDENLELPQVLFEVLASAAHRTGVRPSPSCWRSAGRSV